MNRTFYLRFAALLLVLTPLSIFAAPRATMPPVTCLTRTVANCKAGTLDEIGWAMKNFFQDGSTATWNFEAGAVWTECSDGTAKLTGVIAHYGNATRRFQVTVNFSQRSCTLPQGMTPETNNLPAGTSIANWYYYVLSSGTLIGLDQLAGASLTLQQHMMPSQAGVGGSNQAADATKLGLTGWFQWTIVSQPSNGWLIINNYPAFPGFDQADICIVLGGTPPTDCGTDPCAAFPTPSVSSTNPTNGAANGCINITNLPTGASSSINNGTATVGKTQYCGLGAGTYTITISQNTCSKTTTVILTNTNTDPCLTNPVPTPSVTTTNPTTGAANGCINITNLPTGASSSINNGTATVGKTQYCGLGAGTYTIIVSLNGCVKYTSVTLTPQGNPCDNDVTPPVITCPANITKDASGMTGYCWTINYPTPTATDNCCTPTVTRVPTCPTSGSCFPLGVTTITYKATDFKGNYSTCSFTITITKNNTCDNDVTPPVITCPANITKDASGMTGYCWTINYPTPTATDNCCTPTVTRVPTCLASGSCFPLGVTTVTYKATDLTGNSSTCSFTVTTTQTPVCGNFDPTKCYKIVHKGTGSCLEVYGWGTGNNCNVYQSAYGGYANQQWRIVSVGGGYYRLVAHHSGKVLACHDWYTGAQIYQYDYYTGGAMDWKFECQAGGYYTIRHRLSNKMCDVYGNSSANGARVQIWDENGGDAQMWQVVEVPCNYWGSYLSSNAVLSMTAAAEPTRTRIEWVNNTGTNNDFFTVEKANQTTGVFEKIETLNSIYSENVEHYTVYDNDPTEGDNTYRVTLTYLDGTTKASEIQTLTFKGLEGVRFFPNPAYDYVDVDLSKYKGQSVSIFLYNNFGQQVGIRQVEKVGVEPLRMDISQQNAGNYLIRVTSKGKRDVTKTLSITK